MADRDRYITVRRAAELAMITEDQVLNMCKSGGPFKLRHITRKDGTVLIDRDSLTELFLGYVGGWD